MQVNLSQRGLVFVSVDIILLMIANLLQSLLLTIFVSISTYYLLAYTILIKRIPQPEISLEANPRHGILYRGELEILHIKIQNNSDKMVPSLKLRIDFPDQIFPVMTSNIRQFSIQPHQELTFNIPVLPLARGLFQIGPITVSQTDLFDIFSSPLKTIDNVAIRVYPKRIEAHVNKLKLKEVFSKLIDIYAIRRKGLGNDFHGLREYIRGDPSKIVYWPATAKYDRLISKEFEDEKQLEIMIAMQGGATMRGRKFDFVLGTAMDIYNGILKQGHPVGFIFFDDAVHLHFDPSLSQKQLMRIWGQLYSAEAKDTYVDFQKVANHFEKKKITNRLIIFIGDLEYNTTDFLELARRIAMKKNNLIFIDVRGYAFSFKGQLKQVAKTYAGDEYGLVLNNVIGAHIEFDELFRGIYVKEELKRYEAVYAYFANEQETIVEVLQRALQSAFGRRFWRIGS